MGPVNSAAGAAEMTPAPAAAPRRAGRHRKPSTWRRRTAPLLRRASRRVPHRASAAPIAAEDALTLHWARLLHEPVLLTCHGLLTRQAAVWGWVAAQTPATARDRAGAARGARWMA